MIAAGCASPRTAATAPLQNVSRFFVPRAETSADPLQRDLASVLVHELTHHYVSARWLGDDTTAVRLLAHGPVSSPTRVAVSVPPGPVLLDAAVAV